MKSTITTSDNNISEVFTAMKSNQWLIFVDQLLFNSIPIEPPVPYTETLGERLNWTYNLLAHYNKRDLINTFVEALINTLRTLPFNIHTRTADVFYEVIYFLNELKPLKHRSLLLQLLF